MKSDPLGKVSLAMWVCLVLWTPVAQHSPTVAGAVDASSTVPRLIKYSGVLRDIKGKPLSGVTFLLYKGEQGHAPPVDRDAERNGK